MQPSKPWYQSKTIWLNIVGLLTLLIGNITDPSSAFHFSAAFTAVLTSIQAILNIILRVVTTSAIAPKDSNTN